MHKAVAAIAVIACATACTGGGSHKAATVTRSSPSHSAASSTIATTSRILIGPLSIKVPPGWRLTPDSDFSHSCLEPSGADEKPYGCPGLDAYYDWGSGFLPGNEASDFRQSPGWYHGTGVSPCPDDPTKGPHGLNAISGVGPAKLSLAPVGDRKADYYVWSASCDSGFTWHPRAWYLPISKVLVFDYSGNPQADALMRNATFVKGRWTMAFLHAVSGALGARTIDVDEITWLSGAAANRYAKAHHMESPVPDDYLIVDDDESTVATPISEQAVIVSEFSLAGTDPGHPVRVTLDQLADYADLSNNWGTPFHLHLDASGVIDQVVEQYRP